MVRPVRRDSSVASSLGEHSRSGLDSRGSLTQCVDGRNILNVPQRNTFSKNKQLLVVSHKRPFLSESNYNYKRLLKVSIENIGQKFN